MIQSFKSICPATGETVWEGKAASPKQVQAAVAAARKAFADWSLTSFERRADIAQKYAGAVRDKSEEIALAISRDMGKPLWEARTEANAMANKVAVSIASYEERTPTRITETTRLTHRPHGVMAVLGPFNFPGHLPNGHIIPALLAGNTVVFKPSELTPQVAEIMGQCWEQAGLPEGVLNIVQGARETGAALLDAEIDGLLFTGSAATGTFFHRHFAGRPEILLALEMGGNNPLIVHQAEDVQAAAYLTILSAFYTSGQRCTCARRLILPDNKESDRFLETLVEMMAKVAYGFFDDDPQPFMGTVISQKMGRRMVEAQAELIKQGGKSIVELAAHRDCDALVSPGLIDVTEISDRSDEELFGPLLNIIRVKDFDAAIKEANNTAYGLSAGLLSSSEDCYKQFIHQIRAGIVNWNRQTTGASGKLPFGGSGLSGNHRPSAYFAVDYCSFPVASLESSKLEMPEKLLTGIKG